MTFSLRVKILSAMIMIMFSSPVIAWTQTIDSVQCEHPQKVMAIYSKQCPNNEKDCCISESAGELSVVDLLKAAAKCRGSDNFNICDEEVKATYSGYLKGWRCELEQHLKDLDPVRKLEIRKEIISLKGRIKDIQAVTPEQCLNISCKDCDSVELCRERCLNNRKKMLSWRNRYKITMQGNQYLDCNTCLKALEDYYNEQKEMFFANKLNENLIYTPEHLNVMWGLLYCLSPSTDKKKEMDQTCLNKARKILPHVMLPFVLPPSELLQLFEDRLKKGDLTQEEIRKIMEKKNQAIYVIKVLVELFKESDTIPGMPPADLAAILLKLMEKNTGSMQNIDIKKRLELFNRTFGALSKKELKNYSDNTPDFKKTFAEFIVAALQKADRTTLEMLKSLGFTNDMLVKLIKTQYEKDGNKEKKQFIYGLIKIFDEETIIINEIVSEKFLRIGDETQKRILQDDRYEKEIVRLVDNLRAIKPELVDWERPMANDLLKHKYLKSFLMPGYIRSYYQKEPSTLVKAWNYSNIALLGLAVVSGSAYINTDYDNDALFHIGVTATVAFIVNGIVGAWDVYEPPKNNTDGTAITGPYISINGQYDEPTLMFTFKF